jgi:hypothetical protein
MHARIEALLNGDTTTAFPLRSQASRQRGA